MIRFALFALAAMLAVPVAAAVPPMMSYQGKLMQPSGAPVPDGTYQMQFAIYAVPTGGTAIWSETNSSVQVKGGLFSVLLGSVTNLPANIFDSPDRWFGVTVGGDPEMTPRQKIASVGYAVKAGSADIATTIPDSAVTTSKVALGAITADRLAPGVAIPPGTVLMWSGAADQVPQGWALCNGQSGTPDLRNRFVVGAGDEYAVAATGGEKTHQLAVAEMPSHRHDIWLVKWATGWQDSYPTCGQGPPYGEQYYGGSDFIQPVGSDQPHENRPPYYALCFIMKLGY